MSESLSVEKRHLDKPAARKFPAAGLLGALLSFLYGVWLAPWVGQSLVWFFHRVTSWFTDPSPFPHLGHFFAAPDLLVGVIWLGYYAVFYVWACVSISPREQRARSAAVERSYREQYRDEWSFPHPYSSLYSQGYEGYSPQPVEEPISRAWPGELKHQLVEHCYQQYREALKRFDPIPLTLQTPESFSYQKHGQIRWTPASVENPEPALVLPEEYLTPERIHLLLPLLAGYLYDCNTDEQSGEEEETGFVPDHIPFALFFGPVLFLSGNFLWIPVLAHRLFEDRAVRHWVKHPDQLVLERDKFAVKLGQGPQLEHLLRMMEEELKKRGEIDQSRPTLVERIGQLEVLNARERDEMRKLGLKPKEPPLVNDVPGLQLGQGSRRRKNPWPP
jgi:hypothetical protein